MSRQPNRREFVGTIAVFSLFRKGKMSSFHATKLDISTEIGASPILPKASGTGGSGKHPAAYEKD
jgi:hypothetical protein